MIKNSLLIFVSVVCSIFAAWILFKILNSDNILEYAKNNKPLWLLGLVLSIAAISTFAFAQKSNKSQ